MADRRKGSLASRLGDRGKPSSPAKFKGVNGSVKSRLSLNRSSNPVLSSPRSAAVQNLLSKNARGRLNTNTTSRPTSATAGQRRSLQRGMRLENVASRSSNSKAIQSNGPLGPSSSTKQQMQKKKLITADKNGKTLQIFTKHFDARNKLKSRQPVRQTTQAVKEIVKKSLHETRQQKKFDAAMTRRVPPKNEPRRTQPSSQRPQNDIRKPIFTGKSIKVIAKLGKPSNQAASRFPGMYNSPRSAIATRLIQRNIESPSQEIIHHQRQAPDISPYQISSQGIFAKERPLAALPTRQKSARSQGYPAGNNSVEMQYRAPLANKQKKHYKVVITNLHPDVSEEDINVLFGAVGSIAQAKLVRPGMAEVVYGSLDLASAAHEKYHSRNLDGQPMLCKVLPCHQDDLPPRNDGYSTNYQQPRKLPQPSHNQRRTDSNGQPVVFTVKI